MLLDFFLFVRPNSFDFLDGFLIGCPKTFDFLDNINQNN